MSTDFVGVGTAVPTHSMNAQESADSAPLFADMDESQARLMPVLYRKSGVSKRHMVIFGSADGIPVERQDLYSPATHTGDRGPTTGTRMKHYERHAGALAHASASAALADASIHPSAITHIVTASCSGFAAPGFDLSLIDTLGLRADVARTHVGFMGCHAAMNALRVADAFAGTDPSARVLVCATELCSLHFRYGFDPGTAVTNTLFADGSASVVCAANARQSRWRLRASGSMRMPDSADAMTWRVGDNGFEMTLSPRVPELIGSHLRPWLEGWLGLHGVALGDVQSWAVHPGGPRILQAVAETLGLPPVAMKASRETLAEYGNMSSPTVLFVMERLRRDHAAKPCVALGFGPGLVVEAMLLG